MRNIKSLTSCIIVGALLLFILAGCGGAEIGGFDTFSPRVAAPSDFEGRSFSFGWIPTLNPIDASLGKMEITFGEIAVDGSGTFELRQVGGGSAAGTLRFLSPSLEFTVVSKTGEIPLPVSSVRTVTITADVSDGRIQLVNPANLAEATSDPQE